MQRCRTHFLRNLLRKVPKAADLIDKQILAAQERHSGDLEAMARDLEVSRAALRQRLRQLEESP